MFGGSQICSSDVNIPAEFSCLQKQIVRLFKGLLIFSEKFVGVTRGADCEENNVLLRINSLDEAIDSDWEVINLDLVVAGHFGFELIFIEFILRSQGGETDQEETKSDKSFVHWKFLRFG